MQLLVLMCFHQHSRIFNSAGTTLKINQPPLVFSNTHVECILSFSSPAIFFSSKVRDSSAAINASISSIVIPIICRYYSIVWVLLSEDSECLITRRLFISLIPF